MVCADIGEANADIAGIGIIAAFIFQSLLAFFLSVALDLYFIDPRRFSHLNEPRLGDGNELTSQRPSDLQRLVQLVSKLKPALGGRIPKVKMALEVFEEFVVVAAEGFALTTMIGNLPISAEKVYNRLQIRKIIAGILWTASDAQTLAGIALAITGITQRDSLSLYQFHIIYDTINLTSITNCAAFSAAAANDTSDLYTRITMTILFAMVYLVFVVFFGIQLNRWDDNMPGLCYATDFLAAPSSSHPLVDKVYLGITCLYMFSLLWLACTQAVYYYKVPRDKLFKLKAPRKRALLFRKVYLLDFYLNLIMRNLILYAALMQLPLHLYFLIRLRLTNEPLLQSGGEENTWGFGQIFALVMSVALVVECVKGIFAYREARDAWDQIQKDAAAQDTSTSDNASQNNTAAQTSNPNVAATRDVSIPGEANTTIRTPSSSAGLRQTAPTLNE